MKKEKQSNFELLRIVAMLMIIIFHSLVNFVGTRDSQYISNNIELGGVLLMLRYVFGQLGVILFAMISGYFLIRARDNRTFLALIIVIIFVSVLFKFTLFLSLGRDAINAATIFVGYLLGGYMRKFNPLQHVKSRYLWAGIIMFIAYYMLAHEFLARVLHVWSFDAKPAVGFFIGYPGYVLAAIIFALFMRLNFSSKSVNSLAGTTLFTTFFTLAHRLTSFFKQQLISMPTSFQVGA